MNFPLLKYYFIFALSNFESDEKVQTHKIATGYNFFNTNPEKVQY